MLKEQVVLFAQCMGAEMLAEEIGREWPNMQIRCRPKLVKDGIRHMLITSQVQVLAVTNYVCIHGDNDSDTHMKANGLYFWWLLCKEILEMDAEISYSEYSLPKIRRTEMVSNTEEPSLQMV